MNMIIIRYNLIVRFYAKFSAKKNIVKIIPRIRKSNNGCYNCTYPSARSTFFKNMEITHKDNMMEGYL